MGLAAAFARQCPGRSQTLPSTPYLRITQEQVRWSANPAMPAGVRASVLYGDPRKPGLYVMQVNFPPLFW